MCCFSFLGQLLYGAVMLATLGLTLAAMFSPGWTEIKNESGGDVTELLKHPKGLFSFLCGSETLDSAECKAYFENLPAWEKAVVVLMCLSVVFEVIAILWTLFTIFACCCKKYVIHPLPALAFFLALFLAVVLILYGVYNKDFIKDFGRPDYTSELGYSFYLALGALVGAVVDIIVGALTVALAQKSL